MQMFHTKHNTSTIRFSEPGGPVTLTLGDGYLYPTDIG